MEPPNKGHVGTRSFVLYREVSFILRLKCTGIIGIGTSRFVLYREVLFIRSVLYRRLHCISFSSGTLWPDKLPLQMECRGGGPRLWLTAQRVTQRQGVGWCVRAVMYCGGEKSHKATTGPVFTLLQYMPDLHTEQHILLTVSTAACQPIPTDATYVHIISLLYSCLFTVMQR